MTCHDLAQRLSRLKPELSQVDVARLALIILVQCEDTSELADDEALMAAWKKATLRLEAASDQHAAVAIELEDMCEQGPIRFTSDELQILLRALKVQSQVLELFTDEHTLA